MEGEPTAVLCARSNSDSSLEDWREGEEGVRWGGGGVQAVFFKSSQSTWQLLQIFPFMPPSTWMACDWAYCLSVCLSVCVSVCVCLFTCVCLCLGSTDTALLPSTSRPGMMRWKTTPIPTPTSATPGVQTAARGPCAPTTPRWDRSQNCRRERVEVKEFTKKKKKKNFDRWKIG